MSPLFLIMLACAVIGLGMASAHGDACSDEIARLEALVDQPMGNPVVKPMSRQSFDAQLHHQPTQDSVRRAEENARARFAEILERAKIMNADGKTTECIQSVAEVKRLLGIH
jgi:hypothetical protein